MDKKLAFACAIIVQLLILAILQYTLNIKMYLYGGWFDKGKINAIFPLPKRFNRLELEITDDASKQALENGRNEKLLETTKFTENSTMPNAEENMMVPKGRALLFSEHIEKAKELEEIELLIMVLTAPSKFRRRENIRQTWWRDCRDNKQVSCWFFTDRLDSITDPKIRKQILKEQKEHKDIIFTPVEPGILFGFRFLFVIQWATANYNFNYTLRVDDDVLLCIDHLMWDLPNLPSKNLHYGWLHCQEQGIVYIDEGISMFSNDVIQKFLAQDPEKIMCHPYGDQQVSIWEQDIGLSETRLIYPDNKRIHHNPPASYEENFCDRYIAIHGLYNSAMVACWKKRGNGTAANFNKYTQVKLLDECPHKPYVNWKAFGGMYHQEPKPCFGKPNWDTGGFKTYPGREKGSGRR